MPSKRAATKKIPERNKTEALSIRIDPRVKFGLELLARIQRRSTTGVVEWAIQKMFDDEIFDPGGPNHEPESLADALPRLWHVNEIERIVAVGTANTSLLTYEESCIWKVFGDTRALWKHYRRPLMFNDVNWQRVLQCWPVLEPIIKGVAESNIVRGLNGTELAKIGLRDDGSEGVQFDDDDPDIPF